MARREVMDQRVGVLMTKPQYAALFAAADAAGLSLNAFFRQALMAALKKGAAE